MAGAPAADRGGARAAEAGHRGAERGQRAAAERARSCATALSTAAGVGYGLVQQTKVNGLSKVEAEAMLSRFPVIESGNLDYQAGDMVALVARVLVDGAPLDVYVTHLYRSRGEELLRLFQVQQLLEWIDTRDPAVPRIVCGDFNASLDKPSAALMATRFRPTQTAPTAFTALADHDGSVSHPYWPRLDRCIDYIWVSPDIEVRRQRRVLQHAEPHGCHAVAVGPRRRLGRSRDQVGGRTFLVAPIFRHPERSDRKELVDVGRHREVTAGGLKCARWRIILPSDGEAR